jgi:hypothetical protein
MSTQPVEEPLTDEQRLIRETCPSPEQRKILEDVLKNPSTALKDPPSFVEGILAYQMRDQYKTRARALRGGFGAGAGAAGNSNKICRHLEMGEDLTKVDKRRLRVFEDVLPETVLYWFQQMSMSSCSPSRNPC